jgi:hypothetical protein
MRHRRDPYLVKNLINLQLVLGCQVFVLLQQPSELAEMTVTKHNSHETPLPNDS